MERMKRQPAVERRIGEIKSSDTMVRILGTALEVREGDFTLDDGEGQIVVIADPERVGQLRDGQRVRVLGRIFKDPEPVLQGEIIQDMDGLDLDLYARVRKLLK
jgi:hypothetical protein